MYFLCVPPGPPPSTAQLEGYPPALVELASRYGPLQHQLIVLGEGLAALGVPFFANTDYWRATPDSPPLFRFDPSVEPPDCDVVVLDQEWIKYGYGLPAWLLAPGRRHATVFIDASDGRRTYAWDEEFRAFDVVLRAQYNGSFRYPRNVRPWAYGVSERFIAQSDGAPSFPCRSWAIVRNYRWLHPVRQRADACLDLLEPVLPVDRRSEDSDEPPADDHDRFLWEQTEQRHHTAYYDRLRSSAACAAFGGALARRWPRDQNRSVSRASRILNKVDPRPERVFQWDSWRLWESFAIGCATFHVDFPRYGILLPEMPRNWVHYVGVDLEHPERAVARIADDPTILERIAGAGREWALEHYGPEAMAVRFLAEAGRPLRGEGAP